MRLLVAVVLLFSVGCSSVLDRTVQKAIQTPWKDSGYRPVPGDSAAPILKKLEVAARFLGIAVNFGGTDEANAGETYCDENDQCFINLDEELDVNARAETLAHEIAHTLQPNSMEHRSEHEMFADLVSVGVLKAYGYDTSDTSARYLARYKSGLLFYDLYKSDIEEGIATILEAMEK